MSTRSDLIRRQRGRDTTPARPMKLVVTGPFSAGKTTLIQTISEVTILGTERDVTLPAEGSKTRTTVAMDFGRITFDSELCLYLFGTPGQRRFEMMWEVLSEGMLGFIVLVNAGDQRSVEEAGHILETFRAYADVPYVVGVTHLDEAGLPEEQVLQEVRAYLEAPEDVRVIPCDPRRREDVKILMLEILLGVLRRLELAAEPAEA